MRTIAKERLQAFLFCEQKRSRKTLIYGGLWQWPYHTLGLAGFFGGRRPGSFFSKGNHLLAFLPARSM
jgi:hypothetical protein